MVDLREQAQASIFRPAWFLLNRFVAVVGVACAIPAARYVFGIKDIRYDALWLLTALLLASNLAYCAYHVYGSRAVGDDSAARGRLIAFIAVQITTDLALLTLMLHFSGGATNPFVLYYFFHTMLASILLTKPLAYLEAACAASLFVAMTVLEGKGVVPHYHLVRPDTHDDPVFIAGISVAFVSALFIAVYMAESIMDRLRSRQDELERSLRETARLEAEKSRFLDVVAHDLKSPLAAIETMVTSILAVHGGDMTPKVREVMERIPARTRESIAFIRELLDFSRARNFDAIRAEFGPVDIASLSRDSVALFSDEAAAKNIELVFQAEAGSLPVRGDRDMLARMIGNLVSNAVRYTPDGGRVTVIAAARGGDAVVEVRDTGIGIPEEDIRHVFGDFFRARNARQFTRTGTGLGLSIVRSAAEAHGGSVDVESGVGSGTVFTVRIPLHADEFPNR